MSLDSWQLKWLPPVDEDFRTSVKSLRQVRPLDQAATRRLSTSRLDLSQLHTLARALAADVVGLCEGHIRMSILSNATTELIVPAIVATGPRHDLWLDVAAPEFGAFASEALNPKSATHSRRDEFVLLALDYRGLQLQACPGDPVRARQTVTDALNTLQALAKAIHEVNGAVVIVQTLPPPAVSLFGSLDAQTPGTLRWLVDRYNHQLLEVPPEGALILDVAALAGIVGLETWHDPTQWNIGKFPFSQKVVPLYADWVCRVIAASRGKSKKCLVLDLDNTLWGGVIGDDGLTGIVLGQGSPVGEAHLAVQSAALELRARGVILAVASKNDDATARSMFREHPEMLLREEHIAVFQANWQDKATNLRAIAETLNIGIDSLVFFDDNPAERQQIRLALPQVAVPELPADPDYYPAILLSAGYFELTQFTEEDRQRAAQYQSNAARRASLGDGTDLQEYLRSLDMRAHITPFDEIGRGRITQLINKTNQFNLTTRRYSEADIAAWESDPLAITLQVRLKDRFGDNGMISVVICKESEGELAIDTWLMSCRVLNRGVEEAVLNELIASAQQRGIRSIVGTYIATERNGMVQEHYSRLGFEPRVQTPARSTWSLDVQHYAPRLVPIAVTSTSSSPIVA
jgi:FkbH-like protein